MNGFHVHAIGWVLITNAFILTPAEAHELTDLWTDLVRRRTADLRQAPLLLHVLFPRSLPLAPATRSALATLVARMVAQHPERFGEAALRRRRNHWAGQAALGVVLSGLTALLVPTSWTWAAAPLAPTFFLMGCGCLLPTVTLWRAATAVRASSTGRFAAQMAQRVPHRSRAR
jgi:hypothetical protein